MSKVDELVKYILNLTPEQADRIVKHMDLLKSLTDNQQIYICTLTEGVFGTVAKEGVA